MSELKENNCVPVFTCKHGTESQCVFGPKEEGGVCAYRVLGVDNFVCQSLKAQTNAMALKLKDIGFNFVRSD